MALSFNKKIIINLHKNYVSNEFNCQKDLVMELDIKYYLVGKNSSHKFYLGIDIDNSICKMNYDVELKTMRFEKLSNEFVNNFGVGYIG